MSIQDRFGLQTIMKLERWLAIILVAFVILISLFMLFNQDWIREHTVLRGAVGGSQSK